MRVGGILWGGGQPCGLAAAKTSLFIQKVFECKCLSPFIRNLSLEPETEVRFGKDVSDE
jgi:hypothetical protein